MPLGKSKREFGPFPSTCPFASEPARVVTVSALFAVRRREEKEEKESKNETKQTRMNDKKSSSYAPKALKRTGGAKEEGWWVEDVVA